MCSQTHNQHRYELDRQTVSRHTFGTVVGSPVEPKYKAKLALRIDSLEPNGTAKSPLTFGLPAPIAMLQARLPPRAM